MNWKKARHRAVLCWLLCLLGAVLLFTLRPELDLQITGAVAGSADAGRFPHGLQTLVQVAYRINPPIGLALVLLGLLLQLPALTPRAQSPGRRRWRRRLLSLALVMLLGAGVAVNAILKETWGRPRPVQVQDFGGEHPFRQINQPSSLCKSNCSFVSGHAAAGFALLGLGLMAAPDRRRRWGWIGLGAGALAGLGRVLQGGHFTSDIVFAGLVVWGSGLLCRQVWLAWRLRRLRQRVPR